MKAYRKLTKKIKKSIFSFSKSRYEKYGLEQLKKNQNLFQALTSYLRLSESTGCNYYDYWILYDHIRQHRPEEILECGTGASTLVMAYALMENSRDGHTAGRLTSMEDDKYWHQHAQKLIPDELKPYIDLVYSPKTEYCYSIFRGVGYREIPERAYRFAFIDGPEATAPSDKSKTFNIDLINIVKKAELPISAVVDKRISTCYVFQIVFGPDKVRFSPRCDLGFVGPVIKSDLKPKIGGGDFYHSLKLIGNTRLDMNL